MRYKDLTEKQKNMLIDLRRNLDDFCRTIGCDTCPIKDREYRCMFWRLNDFIEEEPKKL